MTLNLTALATFNKSVKEWVIQAFGIKTFEDKAERDMRFFEEATELIQSRGNLSAEDMHRMIDHVMSRPPGVFTQEVGGTMTTLSALCSTEKDLTGSPVDMFQCGLIELQRIKMPENMVKIREKQLTKLRRSD